MKTFYEIISESEETPIEPEKAKIEKLPLKGYMIWGVTGRIGSSPGNNTMWPGGIVTIRKSLYDALKDYFKEIDLPSDKYEKYALRILKDPLNEVPKIIDTVGCGFLGEAKCGQFRIWTSLTPKKNIEGPIKLVTFDPFLNSKLITNNINLDSVLGGVFLNKTFGDSEKEIQDIIIDEICSYFMSNPLDLHILDEDPELKKKVLEQTGMKDLSTLGRSIKKGLL
jgi:hypothetical protein